MLEIETAQAEVAEQFQSNSSVLPIQPVLESTKITIFLKLAYQEIKLIITYYVFPLHQGYILRLYHHHHHHHHQGYILLNNF